MLLARKQTGSTVLILGLVVILLLIMGGLYSLMTMIGGSRQVSDASDAAVLNIAKQALRNPGVTLTAEETKNFGEFLDDYSDRDHGRFQTQEAKINLMTFNRCVAKALLVSMIAREQGQFDEDLDATKHAQQMCRQAREIGERLTTELKKKDNFTQAINQAFVRNNNSLTNGTEKPVTTNFETGFAFGLDTNTDEGEPTNVYLSDRIAAGIANDKYLSHIVKTTKQDGQSFLAGYRSVWAPEGSEKSDGSGEELMGVAVRNGSQPHLIANRTFMNSTQAQSTVAEMKKYGVPNAFKYSCEITDSTSHKKIQCTSSAVVSSLWTQSPMAIPRGYITVARGNDGDANWYTLRDLFRLGTRGQYKRTVIHAGNKKPLEGGDNPTQAKDSMGKAPESGFTPIGEPELEHATDPLNKMGELEAFMIDRLLQMNPNAPMDKVKEVLNTKFGPNSTWYIYAHYSEPHGKDTDTVDGAFDYFAISPNPPSYVDTNEIAANNAANIHGDGRIREFINATRYSFIQVGSGWHNNLGYIGVDKWPPVQAATKQ